MVTIDRRLLYVAVCVGCFALATLSLVYANTWWHSTLLTLSIGCWLAGLLWTIYAPPAQRTAAIGALVTSFLYVLFAGGPWFQTHVGPWLLTTRALVAIETHVLGRDQPAPGSYQVVANGPGYPGFPYPLSLNSGYATWPVARTMSLWTVPTASGAPEARPTVAVGHWLFAWCAAAIGGFAAAWIAKPNPIAARVQAGAASRSDQGENPFATTTRREVGP
jgi:hypothetical protein